MNIDIPVWLPPNMKVSSYALLGRMFGKEFARRNYLKVCIRRFRDANVIFIHIPKAAGTSIARATIGRRPGHFTAVEVRSAMQSGEFDAMFSFAVTRHPLARAFSAYKFACSGGNELTGVRRDSAYDSPAFRSFDAFVNEWLIQQDLLSVDPIFRPQASFVFDDDGKCVVDYIGCVEDLVTLETRLTQALGRRITIPRINVGGRNGGSRFAASQESCDAIYELYRCDFERFDYALEECGEEC